MDQNALFQISYGLYVITSSNGEKQNGCILNTAIQVTSSPNRVAAAVNKTNFTHDCIVQSRLLNLSILDQSTPFAVFQHFGFQSGRQTDKITGYDSIAYAPNGIAYLKDHTNAYLSASVVQTVDLGTHTLFLADVTNAETLSSLAPITYAFYHEQVKPKNKPEEKTGWQCKICGYVYEGKELPEDFICPICKHGADDFEPLPSKNI